MCGILGIVANPGSAVDLDRSQILRMRDTMTARGPDAAGLFQNRNVAFGHRRLSIRDHAGGSQPWISDDDQCVLVYNGEIYNDGALRHELAALALSPEVRPQILERTRGFIRRGFPVLKEWAENQGGKIRVFPCDAAAIAFARYDLDVNSTELVERLRDELSVLIVPGDHFGIDHCLRISFGLQHDYLKSGLERISAGILAQEPVSRETG